MNRSKSNILKSTFILFVFLGITLFSQAQINKGSWMLGGTGQFSLDADNDFYSFSISPNVGYFLLDNLAAGIRPSFGHSSSNFSNYTSIGGNVFTRKYFTLCEKISLFPELGLSLSGFRQINKFNDTENTGNQFNLMTSLGLTFFLTENFAFEPTVGYTFFSSTNSFNTGIADGWFQSRSLGMNLGFQYYFNR